MHVQEQDFLAAYQGHMRHIMSEINSLKAKLTDKELKIKRDKKVSILSNQVNWFQNEALTLKTEINKKKEITQEVKNANFVLNEEKWALEQALGKSQTKAKNLAEALQKSERNNQELLDIVSEQKAKIRQLQKDRIKDEVFGKTQPQFASSIPEYDERPMIRSASQDTDIINLNYEAAAFGQPSDLL